MAGKSILITGCSSGIGLDAARALQARGWQVFASCRKAEDCDRLKAEGLASPRLDVDDPASIREALAEVLEATGGRLDALFNNAAFGLPGALEDVSREALEAIFSTNLFGLHDLTREVIPVMRRQGAGRIVNCSSGLGLVGIKWRGPYVGTKFALEGMTDVLRLEMRGTGVEVSLIEPGPITTEFRVNSAKQFERWIDWEASARKDEYVGLRARIYNTTARSPGELPASAVTRKLIHAVESRRPSPRYYVTLPTWFAGLTRRVLTTRAIDWLSRRV